MQQGHGWSTRLPRLGVAVVVTLVVAGLSAVGWATSAGASQRHVTALATGLKQVPGTLAGINLATLLSPAPANQQLEIGVGISRPNPAGEQALYNQIYDSSSPLFHHFLTVSQFNARFGVAPATTAAVKSFLTGGGLSVTSTSAGGDYLLATGSVAQIDSLLKISLGQYTYKGINFISDNTAPSVPANLPIDGIAGLENLTHFKPDAVTGRQLARTTSANAAIAQSRKLLTRAHVARAQASTVAAAPGSPVTVSNEGTEQTYTPQDLWGFYNAPGASALTNANGLSDPSTVANAKVTLGQGQIMGIFTEGEDSSVVRNLRLFENTVGLPKAPVRIVETEGTPDSAYSDNSGAIEWYLDSQSSTAMAPDVKQLDLFTAKTFQDADVAQEFDYWANDANGPREMNASFGECEENPTEPVTGTGPLSTLPFGVGLGGVMENLADPFLRQAALEGRTLFASSGDTGSGCPSVVLPVLGGGNGLAIQPVPFQGYPCISDYVVCVGGTTPSSKGAGYPAAAQRSNEQAWTYSGGGSSYFNPAPSFQSAVKNVNIDCVSNDLGTTVYAPGQAPQCRGVPDVADMSGGGNDWFFFYTDGQPSIEGGTSLASPLMMGQWARVQAAASSATQASGGLGFADPTIYKQAANADGCTAAPCGGTYDRDFYDITQSEDAGDVAGQVGAATGTGVGLANGVYGPSAGWDYVSGWGALNDTNFIQDVDGTTNATSAYSGPEATAATVCTATMSSPAGNATDPVSSNDDSNLDITGATLSTKGSNIVATLTVPDLTSGTSLASLTGANFYVGWSYKGTFYYAAAEESAGGSFTYEAGNTGAPFSSANLPNDNQYTDTTAVTGTADGSSGLITITVPASAVGSPSSGQLLSDPQAFAVESLKALSFTVDSADTLRGWSTDDGQADSIGVDVVMDGVPGTSCSDTLASTSASTAQTGVLNTGSTPSTGSAKGTGKGKGATAKLKAPTLVVRKRSLAKRAGLKLSGTARASRPDTVSSVDVAIARVVVVHQVTVKKATRAVTVKKVTECEFLTAKHRWGRAGKCTPTRYFRARGTTKWSYSLKRRFTPGTYRIYERALDNRALGSKLKYQTIKLR